MWEAYKRGFKAYLQLERSLANNSIEAYLNDLEKLTTLIELNAVKGGPDELQLTHLQEFVKWIAELGMTQASQARIISGIRTFYKYC
ncbi:MAG TPA: site-specific integrase, partial [Flavisolibacter sp.]|nr:site-specific integrase [Flavisolibacter sp.]